MKLYISARSEDIEAAREMAAVFAEAGFEIGARWLQIGLTGAAADAERRNAACMIDLSDVTLADALVIWNPTSAHKSGTGGRHVEVGYALALGKRVLVVGSRENVFHYHRLVSEYDTTENAVQALLNAPPETKSMLDFSGIDAYQDFTLTTAKYPHAGTGKAQAVLYNALGVVGEAGEFAEKIALWLREAMDVMPDDDARTQLATVAEALDRVVEPTKNVERLKKDIRDSRFVLPDFAKPSATLLDGIMKELGDVCWYVARKPAELGIRLSTVFSDNVAKLLSRKARNKLLGQGDNR